MTTSGSSVTLASFVTAVRYEDLPARTVAMTKRCLLDAIGVTLAASTLGEGCAAFVDLAIEQGGVPTSTIIGVGRKVPAATAAFANGSMAHALDFEDAHDGALVHPNAATVPAALAFAEALGGVSGRRLIAALAVGCEVVCRLGLALRVVSLDDYGWYPPPILSAFGATAAAAHLARFDVRQVLDAFSLTLCQATCSAELKYSPNSVIRAVRDAFAAKTGVVSTQLAARGVSGFEQPFEGKAGFFALFARGQYDNSAFIDGLGNGFEIEGISFKPWPTCRGTHVYIEAALALAREHSLQAADIARVRAFGHRLNRMLAEPLEQKRRPATAIDAKFSIPFTVATALCRGRVQLDDFAPAALRDSAVLELARRIDFEATSEDAATLADVTQGSLEIELLDGRRLTSHLSHPYGNPGHPIDEAALIAKFVHCAAHARQPMVDASALATRILRIDEVADVGRELMPLL